MKAIILAGGFGTRLRERVSDVPKPMAPIAGRPFLEYQLDILDACGIEEVVMATGYMASKISDYFGEKYKNISLKYAVEEKPLGTGGAILNAMSKIDSSMTEPVLVLNGDTFLKVDLSGFISWYKRRQCDVGIVLRSVPDVARYGSVNLTGEDVRGFTEKGHAGAGLINGGIYLLSREALSDFKVLENFSFEADILQKKFTAVRMSGFICDGFFLDIGTPEDFDKAQTMLPKQA